MGRSSRVRAGCAWRHLIPVLLLFALAGCTSNINAGQTDGVSVETLRAGSKSLVLFHTSLNEDRSCGLINLGLAQRDEAGRWVFREGIIVRGEMDYLLRAREMMLAPGDYGIVGLSCKQGRVHTSYLSKVVQRPNMITGSPVVYDRPFATFRVGAGEVVDIGSIRIATVSARAADGGISSSFVTSVEPIPDRMLADLARRRPDLHKARVVRPMVATWPSAG
jgi:hypothetical protein